MNTARNLENNDPTEAISRTVLAWRRTAMALTVIALLAIKFSIFQNLLLSITATIFALIGAGILFIISYSPKLAANSPFWGLCVASFVIVCFGIVTLLQII